MTQISTSKKSDIDPVFREQCEEHKTQAKDEYDTRKKGEQYKWLMPVKRDWSGDLFDWEGMKSPFDREKSNQWYKEATESPTSPGRSGDLIITTTQIAYLAVMERAFRARHTYRFPRCVAQHLGRRKGHGTKYGAFRWAAIEYVQGIIRQTSGQDDGS